MVATSLPFSPATINKEANAMAKQDQPEVIAPEGFEVADTELDNYEAWNFDTSPVLMGTVVKMKQTTLERQGVEVDTRFAVVRVDDGELRLLWESANLSDFFDKVETGFSIWIHYKGKEPLKGNKTMRVFDARFKRG